MYDKHRNQKIMFQAVVDNCLCIEFNTAKKRDAFVKLVMSKMPNRRITYISSVVYPWNPQDGIHNLESPERFAKRLGVPVGRVERAIENGFLQTENVGTDRYVVGNNDRYKIKGITYVIRESD